MYHFYRYGVSAEPVAEFKGKKIIIAIDSSRTNTAITVDDEYGNKLADFEFGGSAEDDIYEQCRWIRKILSTVFEEAKPVIVGIEDIITKKDGSGNGSVYSAGINIHHSRAVITAVFNRIIFYFQDYHDITPELINNQHWKASVLPEEYRKRSHDKGSLDWHRDRRTNLANRSDDITDSDCIMEYLKMKHNISNAVKITDECENKSANYDYRIVPTSMNFSGAKKFIDNPNIPINYKCNFIANRLKYNEMGYTFLDTKSLPIEVIYSKAYGKFEKFSNQVALLVQRSY